MPKRLRKWNDLAHAAAWLTEQTGESWEALDLANAGSPGGLRLYVHLRWPPEKDSSADLPPYLTEGCPAEICFHNDLERLTQTNEFPLHLARIGEGKTAQYLKFDPGLPYTLDEIIVTEADLLAFRASVKSQKGGSKVDARKNKIRDILSRIEAVDPEFSRDAMQGRKVDFFELCKELEKEFRYIAEATFFDYLPGLCAFKPAAKKTDYYRDIAHKIGVNRA